MENNYQDQAAEYMRLALPLMKKHGLALTPTNYTVWFEYVSGNNFALREAIDKQLNDSEEPFTDRHCRELYERFFDPNKNASALAEMREDIRRILTDILSQMNSGLHSSNSSSSNLSKILDELNDDMSQQQLHKVIQSVVIETRAIAATNQAMTSQLTSIVAEVKDLRKGLDDARSDAKTDTLTQIANRKGFDEALAEALNDSYTTGSQFCLVMADVDSFKALNDEHGHFVGDQVLRVIAKSIKNLVKGHDTVARYGGEEFAIIIRNTTIQNAVKISNKIREEIASKRIQRKDTQQSLGQITVSFGIADYVNTETAESILQRADRALYMSKRNGRNRVTEAQPPIL